MRIIIVGRDSSCDIAVNDAKVSRQHMQIMMNDDGHISVIDLNSTNGSYINGRRIYGESKVTPKDILKVGETVITWDLVLQKLNDNTVISQIPRSNTSTNPKPQNCLNKKSKKTPVWIIILVAIIFVESGVTYYYMRESKKLEQKLLETQEKYIDKYQEIADEKADAEAQKAQAEKAKNDEAMARNRAEREAREANEAKDQAEAQAQEAIDAQEKAEREAREAERRARREAEAKTKAQAEADRLREEAEKAKREADSIAEAQAQAQAQAQAETIAIMDETLDIKMDALNKKDLKAVAEALGLQEVTEKNAKEKIREAFNAANQAGDFDRMKQIYDSVEHCNIIINN